MAVYKTSNSGLLTRREYTSFLAGNDTFVPFEPSGAYDSIASVSGAGNITFSSIPQTYEHLQIRAILRSTSGGEDNYFLRFNGDTANGKYQTHDISGNGSTVSTSVSPLITSAITPGYLPATTAPSNTVAGIIIDILDYRNPNKNTTVRVLTGYDANGSGRIAFTSGGWFDTSAINSITFGMYAGGVAIGERALYGIKGA